MMLSNGLSVIHHGLSINMILVQLDGYYIHQMILKMIVFNIMITGKYNEDGMVLDFLNDYIPNRTK